MLMNGAGYTMRRATPEAPGDIVEHSSEASIVLSCFPVAGFLRRGATFRSRWHHH